MEGSRLLEFYVLAKFKESLKNTNNGLYRYRASVRREGEVDGEDY